MTKYATMNPLGSTDPRDMFDNSQNLDFAMSDIASAIWTDRFGKKRNTFYGFELFARAAISAFGYITIDSFQAGATLTLYNQILRDTTNGEYYRWDGFFPPSGKVVPPGSTPASTGGQGFGAWLSVGSSALRSMLVSSGGAGMIGTLDGHTVQKQLDDSDALLQQHLASLDPHPGLTSSINNAVAQAEAARDAAIATAGPLYATVAEGRAAVADGQTFAVQGAGDIAADIYRRTNSTTQVLIASLPSSAFVAKTFAVNDNLVADGGFSQGYSGFIPTTSIVDIHKFALDGQGHASLKSEYLAETGIFEVNPLFKASGTAKLPAVAGEKYTLSAEVNVDVPAAANTAVLARLSLRYFDSSNVQLDRRDADITKLNRSGFNSGMRNSVTLVAPANAAYLTAHLYRQTLTGYSAYGFGKVKVEKGDLSPYSLDAVRNFDESNLLYDPSSRTFPPLLNKAVLEKDSYGGATIVGTEIGIPAVAAHLYTSNKIECHSGDSFSFAIELDASGTDTSTIVIGLRGFNSEGVGVWSSARTLPVSDVGVQWGVSPLTRSLACVSGTPSSDIAYIVARVTSTVNSNYTKLKIRNLSCKRGLNNFEFSVYQPEVFEDSDFIAPSAVPFNFEFWPKGWQVLPGAYDNFNWENVRGTFGTSVLSLKPAFISNGATIGMLTERQPVAEGDIVSYSIKLAGLLSVGALTIGLTFYDANTAQVANRTLSVPYSALSENYTTYTGTYTAPAGAVTVALRVMKNSEVNGSLLLVKDPVLVKSDEIPVSYQPHGDLRAISDEVKDLSDEIDAIKDFTDNPIVGWATGNSVSYFTGEASNAFILKPTTPNVPIDTPPVIIPVTAATHISATRLLIMAPGMEKTGNRLWAVYSAGTTTDNEAADDFNIIQYSDDDGVSWVEAFYWKSPDTTKYRLNTPHVYVEANGSLTFFTGYDGTFAGGDSILGSWAFTIKNPQKASGNFVITRSWRVLPTGYPNGLFDSDGRKIIIGGTPTASAASGYRGVNFYKYDSLNRWTNREANFMPSVKSTWTEAQAVQLSNGSHMMMFRADASTLRVAYSADGLDTFGVDTVPSFLPATTASRFALRMSPTGRLYLLYNAATDRRLMTLALLNESGTAVDKTILVEPRQTHSSSYPDLKFAGDDIYMVWDYIRTTAGGDLSPEIVMSKLSEADFVANGSSAVLTSKVIATKNPNPYAG